MFTRIDLTNKTVVLAFTAVAAFMNGCAPATPDPAPTAQEVFNPDSGFAFDAPSASINLLALNSPYISNGGLVCYRVDETSSATDAGINGASCAAGSTVFNAPIAVNCSQVILGGPIESYTLSIVFAYDNGVDAASVHNYSAQYTVDCAAPAYAFDVGVSTDISGATTGTGTGSGTGKLNPTTGELTYSFTLHTVTGFTDGETTSSEKLIGTFNDPVFSVTGSESSVLSCTDNGGLVEQCGQINGGVFPSPVTQLNITQGTPITIPEIDGTFQIMTETLQGGGLVTAITTYTFTRVEPSYKVGGSVSGLTDSGGVLQLQINGNVTVDLTDDGDYEFAGLPDTAAYDVQIIGEPSTVSCSFDTANNSGTIAADDVSDLNISCACTSTLEGNWTWEVVWGDCSAPYNDPVNTAFDANGEHFIDPYMAASTQNGCAVTVTTYDVNTEITWFVFDGTMSNDGQTFSGNALNAYADPDVTGCFIYTRQP